MFAWWSAVSAWASSHQRGGMDFIEFCTALNLAQVGWKQFQDKVRYAETRYGQMLASAGTNLSYVEHKNVLKFIVKVFLGPIEWIVHLLWGVNYGLSLLSVIAGVGMLYFNATCVYDFFLLVPPVAYIVLTYLLLGLLWIVLKIFRALVNKYEAERAAQDFVDDNE